VGESAFMHTKVNQWTSNVVVSPSPRSRRANSSLDRPRQRHSLTRFSSPSRASQEGCLKRLAALNKPFKFVCTVNFVQKAGAGMHTASTALWDSNVDGKHTVQWENNTIQCITTVYWLAI